MFWYYVIDLLHADGPRAENACKNAAASAYPNNTPSSFANDANTITIAKTPRSFSASSASIITAAQDGTQHADEILTRVQNVAWGEGQQR